MQEAYRAIADPTRRRILKDLQKGEQTAGELAEHANVGRTALSHHLTVLKLADLVRVERRGQFQVYTLNTTVLQDLMTEIFTWFGGMESLAEGEEKATLATESDQSPEDTKERYEHLK